MGNDFGSYGRIFTSNIFIESESTYSEFNTILTDNFRVDEKINSDGLTQYYVSGNYYDKNEGLVVINTVTPLEVIAPIQESDEQLSLPTLVNGHIELLGDNNSKVKLLADNFSVTYSIDADGDGIYEQSGLSSPF